MDTEIEKKRLIKIYNPGAFMRYVLLYFKKDKGKLARWKHVRAYKKYKNFGNELSYVIGTYIVWGYLEEEKNPTKTENGGCYITDKYRITSKGLRALKWRIISPFYPGWLSENRKYAITTTISVLVLLASGIALIRTCSVN